MTKIAKSEFGKLSDGRTVSAFTMRDGENRLTVLDYGGILQGLVLPDREGKPTDVLLGYDDVAGYLGNGGYLGALIGRFGNRIDQGSPAGGRQGVSAVHKRPLQSFARGQGRLQRKNMEGGN